MGVNADKQSFLNAVMLATPFKSTEEMLDMLFKNLTTELFITLKNGSLRYVFKDKENDTPENALEKFKNYVMDINNVVDERIMWELLSSSGIVMNPINIIIIRILI